MHKHQVSLLFQDFFSPNCCLILQVAQDFGPLMLGHLDVIKDLTIR